MPTSNPVRKSEKKLRLHVLKHGDVNEKYHELVNNIVLAKLQEVVKKVADEKSTERARISALTDDEILNEDFEKNALENARINAAIAEAMKIARNKEKNKKKNKKKKEKAKAKKKKMMEDRPPKNIRPCLDTVLARIETLEKMNLSD